jgi:small subunit ribosomal protein S5
VIGKFGAGEVLMKPAAPGTGVIAGGAVRAVVEAAGIKDIRTKALRSNNPCNVVSAAMAGLMQLRTVEEAAASRGKTAQEIVG